MKHDADLALAFLRQLYADGPWHLVSIDPDTRRLVGAKFAPDTADQLRTWLAAHERRNIYYHLNRPMREIGDKASRTDISEMSYLHVDLDPRAGENVMEEQARILKLLTTTPPPVHRPTAVVYSGGGYQAIWKLETPVPINGDLDLAEDAKRYNVQLEIQLGGDNCHNIDRILRVPGTVNWPDEKKRLKGRSVARAELLYFEDTTYAVSDFVQSVKVQMAALGTLPGPNRVVVPTNVEFLTPQQISELNVSDRTKMLIVQGRDPDEPNKWESRSELLFHVCCELVRGGCSNEQIYAIVTDPDLRISASVLDKKDSQRYATRQIERAREDAIDPWLAKLNDKHAVIGNMGGKCRIVQRIFDSALNRYRLTKQSFEDFRNRYMHIRVEVGKDEKGNPVRLKLGHWWLENEHRRQFESIVFAPGKDIADVYNLWQGFACTAKLGDKHESFLRHTRDNICSGDEAVYTYLLRWMARAVQHPDSPGQVAVALRGGQGTGKSFWAKTFGSLFGPHFMQISDPKHMVGSFNAHLRDCVVLFGDEAFYAGDNKHKAILKALITEEYNTIEGKGVDAETAPNYVHLILASNSNWMIPADSEERRYLVLDVGEAHMQDHAYFEAIRADLDDGGREALLHFLMTLDVRGFNVRDFPRTDALREQKLLSMTPEEEWFFGKLQEGILLSHHAEWGAPILKKALHDDYINYTMKVGFPRRSTSTALGRFLQKACPPEWPRCHQGTRTYTNEIGARLRERAYYYEFPPVEECRAHWDRKFGGPHNWPKIVVREIPSDDTIL